MAKNKNSIVQKEACQLTVFRGEGEDPTFQNEITIECTARHEDGETEVALDAPCAIQRGDRLYVRLRDSDLNRMLTK
jgi:hypothetical protein